MPIRVRNPAAGSHRVRTIRALPELPEGGTVDVPVGLVLMPPAARIARPGDTRRSPTSIKTSHEPRLKGATHSKEFQHTPSSDKSNLTRENQSSYHPCSTHGTPDRPAGLAGSAQTARLAEHRPYGDRLALAPRYRNRHAA